MNFYAATLGQLLIVEAFVFYIWLKVLLTALKSADEPPNRRLLITSIGLVISSIAIFGIMATRSLELYNGKTYITAVTSFYVALGTGNFMFMIAAALNKSWRQIVWFFIASGLWSALYLFTVFN